MLEAMTERSSVALLVSEGMERRLRHSAPFLRYTAFDDWLELAFVDLESPPLVFIVDPTLVPAEFRGDLLRFLGKKHRIPVVLYVKMTPSVATVLLDLGRTGIRWVMFLGIDDTPIGVRSILARALLDEGRH